MQLEKDAISCPLFNFAMNAFQYVRYSILSKLVKTLFLLEIFLVTLDHACQVLAERRGNYTSNDALDVLSWQPSIEVILEETEQGARCTRVAFVRYNDDEISSVRCPHKAIISLQF